MSMAGNVSSCRKPPDAEQLGPGRSCEDIHGTLVEIRVDQADGPCAICVPRVCSVRGIVSLKGLCQTLIRELHGKDGLAPHLAMVYPPTDALRDLEPEPSGFIGDAWALPVGVRPRPEPTVIIPTQGHSDAYREHISAAALAIDAMGFWRVWLTDAQVCIEDSGHTPEDARRLARLNRNELVLMAELMAQRQPVPRQERPLVVVLHYGWVKLAFGLGLSAYEQLPEPVRHVFVTVYETDGMTLGVRTLSRRMDEVWTTCYNNAFDARATFGVDAGASPTVVDVPQAMPVLPQRMSTGKTTTEAQREALFSRLPGLAKDARAIFLFMKRHNYDTGWDVLLRAFVQEFPPGPRSAQLILKLGYHTEDHHHSKARLEKALAACSGCPSHVPSNVFILNQRLSDTDLRALYDIADAYVEPGRGSGCMSVTAMRMMLQARPVFGPSWNFCSRCRVGGSRDGSSGVFTVQVSASIPAYTEVWQDFALLADQLDQDYVEIDEQDLRRQMSKLAALSSLKRRVTGIAAVASALHLADRVTVGTGLLTRLEALQAQYIAGGRSAKAPRILRRWAPRVQDRAGAALPPAGLADASWAPFVPSGRPPTANLTAAAGEAAVRALALKAQAAVGRMRSEEAPLLLNKLLRAFEEKMLGDARMAAEILYRCERSPESLLALSAIWFILGQAEPALLWTEVAWELLRRPKMRTARGSASRLKESWELKQVTELTLQLHCTIFQGLPDPVPYYDYVRNWPVRVQGCPVRPLPGTPRAKAYAHAKTAVAHMRGEGTFANIGFAADFAHALSSRSEADRNAAAVQHFSIAVMLQPSDGRMWQGLALAFTRHRLASDEEPNRDFVKQQLRILEMAALLQPSGAGPSWGSLAPTNTSAKGGHADYQQIQCTTGILSRSGQVCCAKECGTCGGPECSQRPGGGMKCCGGSIQPRCWSFQGPPPCIYHGTWAPKYEMCSDGVLSLHDHTCCPKECGTCGGRDCASRPGGAEKCCGGVITKECSSSKGPPPCLYTRYEQTTPQVPENGMTGNWSMNDAREVLQNQRRQLLSLLYTMTMAKAHAHNTRRAPRTTMVKKVLPKA